MELIKLEVGTHTKHDVDCPADVLYVDADDAQVVIHVTRLKEAPHSITLDGRDCYAEWYKCQSGSAWVEVTEDEIPYPGPPREFKLIKASEIVNQPKRRYDI